MDDRGRRGVCNQAVDDAIEKLLLRAHRVQARGRNVPRGVRVAGALNPFRRNRRRDREALPNGWQGFGETVCVVGRFFRQPAFADLRGRVQRRSKGERRVFEDHVA